MQKARLTHWAADKAGDAADTVTWLPAGHRLRRPLERLSIRLHKSWRRQIAQTA